MINITDYIKTLTGTEIAVVGMAFRFPGANTEEDFWNNLMQGQESSLSLSDEQLAHLGITDKEYTNPAYVRTVIEEPLLKDQFDHHFFGYVPEEAGVMDPQTRVFHELAWEALESAGYAKAANRPVTGIFAGGSSSFNHELLNHITGKTNQIGFFNAVRLANKDYMCSRVAYALNLTGPCYSINTTCSTSLAAVHLACRAIITGECKMALAGGASIGSGKTRGYQYEEGGVLSKDGHCRTFDATSTGTNFGQGAGIVILKRLKEAVTDGDRILAVIKGSAVNNDGNRKVGYTAPSVEGQKEVIRMAHKMARVNPAAIRLMEAHGTGTPLGDPIEMEALRLAFDVADNNYCAIGSIKSNFGHLDSAAGIAGLIKTILSLKNKQLPPSLHFKNPNPSIDFENSPFYVNTEPRPWETDGQPRFAALSSFGIGGTNVHIVLEEAPELSVVPVAPRPELLLFSAKTTTALQASVKTFHDLFAGTTTVPLNDIAFTLQEGRESFAHRAFVVATGIAEAAAAMHAETGAVKTAKVNDRKKNIVFMFPGQGSQYMGIAGMLYAEDAVFKKEVDQCLALLPAPTAKEIKAIIEWQPKEPKERRKIISTRLTQPLLFIIQYSLSQMLLRLGIQPDAMIGHSLGEYVAACLSGVFTLPDALKVIQKRGELMQDSPEGAMLSVTATEETIKAINAKGISIAAINAKNSCVVAGAVDAIENLEERLANENIVCVRLHTDRAFHSTLIEGVLDEFRQLLQGVVLHAPAIPFISCLSGKFIDPLEAVSPDYWVSHLRNSVRFYDGVNTLATFDNKIIIEVGTARALSTYVRECYKEETDVQFLSLIRHPEQRIPERAYFLEAIGAAWLAGCNVNWKMLRATNDSKRVALPVYPFERKDFSISKDLFDLTGNLSLAATDKKEKENNARSYTPCWKRMTEQVEDRPANKILVVADSSNEITTAILNGLKTDRPDAMIIENSNGIQPQNPPVALGDLTATEAFFRALHATGFTPELIIVGLPPAVAPQEKFGRQEYERVSAAMMTIIHICRSFSAVFTGSTVLLKIINNNSCEIIGGDLLFPLRAAVNTLAGVVTEEYPNISVKVIDIDATERSTVWPVLHRRIGLASLALNEEMITGIRRTYRWQPLLEPVLLPESMDSLPVANNILITGGLGGLGIETARFFSGQTHSNCILISRTQLPPVENWDQWLTTAPAADPVSRKIALIRSLETTGTTLLHYNADVADKEAMMAIMEEVRIKLGAIDAVIHAAGSPVRRVIERMSAEELASQWKAKVDGLQVLNDLFANSHLQFFINFSSINAYYPVAGQAGYATANAVQDAFALQNDLQYCDRIKTINWNTWRSVGMAAEAHNKQQVYLSDIELINDHPLLRYSGVDKDGSLVFISHLSPSEDWVLNEHRIFAGMPVLPGTAYIEMLNAAANKIIPGGIKELNQVSFLAPMIFRDDKTKLVITTFQKTNTGYKVSISSQDKEQGSLQVHFTSLLLITDKTIDTGFEVHWDDEAVHKIIPDQEARGSEFGPRWNNIQWLQVKGHKMKAALSLPALYKADMQAFHLHPALLDIAIGALYFQVKKDKSYLPAYYEKMIIAGKLTTDIQSYIVQRPADTAALVFDVNIIDNEGKNIVRIEGLSYLPYQPSKSTGGQEELNGVVRDASPAEQLQGFATEENMVLLAATICSDHKQVIVRPANGFPQRQEHKEQADQTNPATGNHSSPHSLSDVEERLLEEWKKFFGSDTIGPKDDFFELGGDSVKVTIVLSRINKSFQASLSISDFFNHPTVSELAALIMRSKPSVSSAIRVAEKKEYYALSAAQKRVHILELLHEGSTLYNITEAFELEGDFDLQRFEAACKQLLNRHESLRTSVIMVNGRPQQKIHATADLSVEYYDGNGDNIMDRLYQFRRPFNMAVAPLMRVGIFRVANGRHYVVIDLLHLIADGTSLLLIINELMESYKGAEIATPVLQYKDFAEWQSHLISTGLMEKQKTFWQEQLKGKVERVWLPYDFARTDGRSNAAGNHEFSFSPELSAQLRRMCHELDCTAFMALTALFNTFFHRLSSQNDILIGIPHLGRVNEDFSNVVGMFINTVLLRNFPEPDKRFDRLVAEVKENTLNVFENLDFQYEMILEMLRKEKAANTDNLLSVFFNYRNMFVNAGKTGSEQTSLKLKSAGMKDNFAKFDLSIYAYDLEEGFVFTCNYAEGLFTSETISYLMDQFINLVELVSAEPDKTLSEYEVFTVTSQSIADQADVFNF